MPDTFTQSLARPVIALLERGLLPETVVRGAIRKLCRDHLRELDSGDAGVNHHRLLEFVSRSQNSAVALTPDKANEQHYELPAAFYALVLGPRRKYSSCLWHSGVSTLAEAEEAALEETCRHAGLVDGQQILELGCGWGSLTLWVAQKYPQSRITAVSNSNSQREFIEAEAARRGFNERVRIITADMNDFATSDTFDRVVSVEMFEHMRNHKILLKRIRPWLAPGGKLFVHIFCHKRFAYEFQTEGTLDWMGRYFFTGGMMPSEDWLSHFNTDLKIVEQWRWEGDHYQKTSDAWLRNLEFHRREILPILEQTYGQGESQRWYQRWRIFFLAVAETFGYQRGHEWFVSHYLFEPA